MARSKSKKNGRKGKTYNGNKRETAIESGFHKNLGPYAGVAAVAVVFLAIWFRPSQTPQTNDSSTNPAKVIENLTVDSEEWVPADTPSKEKNDVVEPPAEPELITKGFSMAAFHNTDDYPVKKEDLIHYLRYDDGYTVCLEKEDLEYDEYGVWELKQAKLQYLETIANHKPHWIAESPLAYKATCRILSLTHEDFDGLDKFMDVMRHNDTEEILKFSLEKQNDASEFRTIVCLSRLTDLMVDQTKTPEFLELKRSWAYTGVAAKEATEAAPAGLISYGWTAKKAKDSSFHYYQNGPFTTWIRPTSRPLEKGTRPLGKKEKKASLVVRKNPCSVKDSMPLIESQQEGMEEALKRKQERKAEALRKDEEAKRKAKEEAEAKKHFDVHVTHEPESEEKAALPLKIQAVPTKKMEEPAASQKSFSIKSLFGRNKKKKDRQATK